MAKQTIYLFIRALIIGLLLNVIIQQVSDISPAQQDVISSQESLYTPSQSSPDTQVYFVK